MTRYAPLQNRVDAIAASGLKRTLRRLEMTGPVTGHINGAEVTVFCSNDYLGLAHSRELVR